MLVEAVQDYTIFTLDAGGHVNSWNVGAERLKGYQAEEILGQHFSKFYPPEDIAAGKPQHELEIASREGRVEDEGWRLRKDGSRFWANVIITATKDQRGAIIGFAKVTRDMRIAKEEIFGPVLSILTYKTEAEAIEIANDTEFGLIAYVSSADPERANRVARKLAAGRVLINTIGHDPFAPFGGFKQSGIGREGGIFGLEEYLEPKAIIS